MENKTLYTIIVHSENIAGLLNQVTAVLHADRLTSKALTCRLPLLQEYTNIQSLAGQLQILWRRLYAR